MASDRPLWHIKYQDPAWPEPRQYTFDPRSHLTVSALRQIKQWYGPTLGRYLSFISEFAQGDPEAALCAIWLVRKAAGEDGVPEPNKIPDFAMGDFYDFFEPPSDEDPTPPPEGEAVTQGSTGTPRNSDSGTSESSPTSAISPPETSTVTAGDTTGFLGSTS